MSANSREDVDPCQSASPCTLSREDEIKDLDSTRRRLSSIREGDENDIGLPSLDFNAIAEVYPDHAAFLVRALHEEREADANTLESNVDGLSSVAGTFTGQMGYTPIKPTSSDKSSAELNFTGRATPGSVLRERQSELDDDLADLILADQSNPERMLATPLDKACSRSSLIYGQAQERFSLGPRDRDRLSLGPSDRPRLSLGPTSRPSVVSGSSRKDEIAASSIVEETKETKETTGSIEVKREDKLKGQAESESARPDNKELRTSELGTGAETRNSLSGSAENRTRRSSASRKSLTGMSDSEYLKTVIGQLIQINILSGMRGKEAFEEALKEAKKRWDSRRAQEDDIIESRGPEGERSRFGLESRLGLEKSRQEFTPLGKKLGLDRDSTGSDDPQARLNVNRHSSMMGNASESPDSSRNQVPETPLRTPRDVKQFVQQMRDTKDPKETREVKDTKEVKETRDVKENVHAVSNRQVKTKIKIESSQKGESQKAHEGESIQKGESNQEASSARRLSDGRKTRRVSDEGSASASSSKKRSRVI